MPRQVKTAWLIYWQVMGAGKELDVEDDQVVTVLSSRMGVEKATAALELLYKQSVYTLHEQVKWRQQGSGPYKVMDNLRFHGVPVTGLSYSIGHNPMLTLRKVERLQTDESSVSWVEKGVEHPAWLCKETGYPECELAGVPARLIQKTYSSNR